MRHANRFLLLLAVGACKDEATPLDLADEPAAITAPNGAVMSAGVGQSLPLTVIVVDGGGRPVPAVEVRFLVSAGEVAAAQDSTDESGTASTMWTLPAGPGTAQAAAQVAGLDPMLFTATVSPIAEPIVFRYFDAGSYHACGITTTEQLLCWGYGADGQLGNGGTEKTPFPTLIPGDLRFRLVSGGRYHACGLTLAGIGQCWGNNADGRLGDGNSPESSTSPQPVIGPSLRSFPTFQAIQAGRLHSCGIDLSQHAWCWGYNGEGELGREGFAPGQFSDLADTVRFEVAVKAIATGGLHTCAVSTAGEGFCWGYNVAGQLGNGTTATTGTPAAVAGGLAFRTDPAVIFPSPSPDFPLPPGPFLAAGHDHTCAIATDTETYCWGLNQDGQLGDNTRTTRTAPTAVSGAQVFVAITAGLEHTCALDANGVAFCWGDNSHGQLGDGSIADRLVPTAVSGGVVFAYLKAGDISTCGVTSEGVAYCWGDNEYGQLGNGTTTASSVPVEVAFQP